MRLRSLSSAVVFLWASHSSATTHTVDPLGAGDFPTIQAAIDAAADGDTVALEEGTFTGSGNRDVSFLGKAIAVRSASGDPTGCVIDVGAEPRDEHRAFVFANAEGSGSVLEGITIVGGRMLADCGQPTPREARIEECAARPWALARQADDYRWSGGAVFCDEYAAPVLRNCIFRDNEAKFGGAVGVARHSAPTIVDCVFLDNYGCEDGGAIAHEMYGYGGSVTVQRCRFEHNLSGWHGGAIALSGGRSEILDSVFEDNLGESGGALFTCSNTAVLTRCTFARNTAFLGGAGMT